MAVVIVALIALFIVIAALRILARWILPKPVADSLFNGVDAVFTFLGKLSIVVCGLGILAMIGYAIVLGNG